MSFPTSPGSRRCICPVPSRHALAFAGSQTARHSRCYQFRGLTDSPLLRPVELPASLFRRLLLPSFPSSRSPFSRSDMTTVATEQFPPMGLPPIGTSASIAAKVPSLLRSYPVSQVVRTSPPPHTARPISHQLPVDPDSLRSPLGFPVLPLVSSAYMPSPLPRQV